MGIKDYILCLSFPHLVYLKAPACIGDTCLADYEGLKLLPFPKLPPFDPCSYYYLKQRAGSLVAEEVVAELSKANADLTNADILQKTAMALDPLRGDQSMVSSMFEGSSENLTSLSLSDCPSRPKLPAGVLHARTIEEISFGSLFRLSVWYHKPMLFFSVATSPSKDTLRKSFLEIAADFADQLVFVLADTQELYKYSVHEHRNLLSGNVVSYYLTHALRAMRPNWSFNFDPVGGSMENPSSVRGALDNLVKEEKHEKKHNAPACSKDVPAPRFTGSVEDSLKPFQLRIEEGRAGADPTEKFLEVPRVSNISSLEFLHRYFLKGMPVIVTDAMKKWPGFGKWNRKWLFKTYKKHIRKDGFPDDEQHAGNWIVASQKVKDKLRKSYTLPYFLDLGCPKGSSGGSNISATSPLTSEYFYQTPDTKYAVVKHLDTNCHQTYSAQLEGNKQWILWPPDNDKLQRKPMATVMTPGDTLVFYSGWYHATRNIEDKPSLALSSYFSHPVPSNFLWDNQEFLLNTRQYGTCGTVWRIQTGLPFWENVNFSRFANE